MDEILSYLLISDPSLSHLNDAVVSGFEQTPPVYANLMWVIAHAISLNVVFLKAVSILIFATTLTLFYRYTTRLVGSPVINFFLITGVAAFSYINITLGTQIRSYVLFFLITFIYLMIAHRLTRRPTQAKLLVAHSVVGLLMLLTHNFGLFYLAASGSFFWLPVAMVERPAVLVRAGYLWAHRGGVAFGVVSEVCCAGRNGRTPFVDSAANVHHVFRYVGELAPTVSNRIEEIAVPLPAVFRTVVLLALFGFIAVPALKKGFNATVADPAFMFYLQAGFIVSGVIVITLVVSLVHTSLFISRYMWPSHLLVIYQLVYAFYYIAGLNAYRLPRPGHRLINGLLPVYMAGLAAFLFYQSRKLTLAPTTVMAYVDQLDKKYPVFLESSISFMPVWYYNPNRPIHFLLDYTSAFDPRNDPGATVGFHTLAAVKAKYNVGAVMPVTDFNATQVPHFFCR